MPIPTDTYRNIKVLNWIFAASALLLLGVMGLSVIQDFYKSWREPQISNRGLGGGAGRRQAPPHR